MRARLLPAGRDGADAAGLDAGRQCRSPGMCRMTGNSIWGTLMPSTRARRRRQAVPGRLPGRHALRHPELSRRLCDAQHPCAGRVLALREPHAELLLQGKLHRRDGARGGQRSAGISAPADRQAPSRDKFLGVLNAAAERAGWATPLPHGHSSAASRSTRRYGTFVAAVAEVSVGRRRGAHAPHRRRDRSRHTWSIPLTAEMQIESAVVFGLTAALYGEITIKDGRVEQSNFNDYRMLRIAEMPKVRDRVMPTRRLLGRLRRAPRCGRRAGVVQCHLRGDRQAHPLAAAEEPRPEKGIGSVRRPCAVACCGRKP